jgi:hypothetical protein
MGSKKYRQLLWREKSEMVVSDKEIRYAIFTILTHLRLLHLVSHLIYLSCDDGYGY